MHLIMGIDPDVEKNGIAFWDVNQGKLILNNWRFPILMERMQTRAMKAAVGRIRVEAGWLNKPSNWHKLKVKPTTPQADKIKIFEKISQKVGRNHQTGILIVECLRHFGYNVEEVKPIGKVWDSHEKFVRATGYDGKRSNQETRDAAALVYAMQSMRSPW